MKTDRLLGIVTWLLQKGHATAPELAQHFEVSRRTIMRDLEAIGMSGIPLMTRQGGHGGISIAEGFRLDRQALRKEDMEMILAGLESLESVGASGSVGRLMHTFSPPGREAQGTLSVDLASHYHDSLRMKIRLFREAIQKNLRVTFDYYAGSGTRRREVEPYLLSFRWGAWYLEAWCTLRQEFRMFKLNRLWKPAITTQSFDLRPFMPRTMEDVFPDTWQMQALFHNSVAWRLVEDYGPDCFEAGPDGWLRVSVGYTRQEYMLSWLLSFGDCVRVLEPPALVQAIQKAAEGMLQHYTQKNS